MKEFELFATNDYLKTNEILKLFVEEFTDKDVTMNSMYKICSFLESIENIEKNNFFKTTENVEDYFRKNFRKVFFLAFNICTLSDLPESDFKQRSLTLEMEYYLLKYRSTLEQIFKILNNVIEFDQTKYKKENKINKKIKSEFVDTMKMNYLIKKMESSNQLNFNRDLFKMLINVRNEIIHGAAYCNVYPNEKSPVFQAYDIDVDDLLDGDFCIHTTNNLLSCPSFVTTSFAYLVVFIDLVFDFLRNNDNRQKEDDKFCKLNYRLINGISNYECINKDKMNYVSNEQLKFIIMSSSQILYVN